MIAILKESKLSGAVLIEALKLAFLKLSPKYLIKNPVMFVVGLGSTVTTLILLSDLIQGHFSEANFSGQISFWLWATVLFSNFAEALAEGRGKAQADSLRKSRKDTLAKRVLPDGTFESVSASSLKKGDVVFVIAGEQIPSDGTVIEGIASIDESAITGESAPVIRESGGDRSAVTGGTAVLSDQIKVLITAEPGKSFLDKMIALVEGAERKKTPNEIALNILLAGLTIIFLVAVVTLKPFGAYAGTRITTIELVALLVCLIPTTIGGLLSAIGIAGMDRLLQRNVLALSGRAVEAAGDVDVLLLDKTGTITLGNRMASEFIPDVGIPENELARMAALASSFDETPEGRSIVTLARSLGIQANPAENAEPVHFTAQTRMSGINLNGDFLRKGAMDSVARWVQEHGGSISNKVKSDVEQISRNGGTPLVVSVGKKVLGTIYLKDVVKPGIKQRFERIRAMGIRTVMITGDNRLTAAAIAKEAGVDDFLAEATPEDKLALIVSLQKEGRMVAMSGDGTNDAPALAQSDVGLVMNTGTQAAREAGNMIDLDSDPTKAIEIVEIGKQLLITRGALTTFSIANDVAKYFAIIPAIFLITLPELNLLNVMKLGSPKSAILSAVIFNALVIVALVPLALRGVNYRPQSAGKLLRYNLLVFGLGGIIVPFVGIKALDMVLVAFNLI